jgi:large subunit ribosomal protein L28
MASVCDICGKKPGFGMNVSHSHRRTKRRWNPNVQRVRALVNGAPKRLHVCTSCIRAGKVTKPPRRVFEQTPAGLIRPSGPARAPGGLAIRAGAATPSARAGSSPRP